MLCDIMACHFLCIGGSGKVSGKVWDLIGFRVIFSEPLDGSRLQKIENDEYKNGKAEIRGRGSVSCERHMTSCMIT